MWKKNNNSKMHGTSEIGPNVPAFLVKLWKLVEDPECDLIYWSETGMSFIIVAQARFAREVLPLHYKHNNMASFIRQLNMYDFHKIASIESGGLKSDKDEMEFAHQYFIKDHPYLLENIKRKLSNPKTGSATVDHFATNGVKNSSQPDIFAKVLSDVNILKGKQESWDAKLSAMKRENEALWRELAVFRQKHMKQEQIINRLIHFIVTIVQPSRKVPLRRRFPLMLNDTQHVKKMTKLNGNTSSHASHGSPPGPTIHEIDSDALIGNNEKNERSELVGNEEFISTDFPDQYGEVSSPSESELTEEQVLSNSVSAQEKGNPSDWLEIVLTEDDMVTNPLTPIDPAIVNPVVAAATLKHLESKNKIAVPIKIPSIVTLDGKKKTIPQKKIIYLTEVKKPDKIARKRALKQPPSKMESNKIKGSISNRKNTTSSGSVDTLLDLGGDKGTSTAKILTIPVKATTFGKRKPAVSPSSSASTIPDNGQNAGKKPLIRDTAGKQSASDDSFWKLESLYNGSIGVNELISEVDEEENPIDDGVEKSKDNFIIGEDRTSGINLCDVDTGDIELPKLSGKDETENNDSMDFTSEPLAVVPQSSSQSLSEELSRGLSSHVENVQGEIDYLREVLKGEGYNLDLNNVLGCLDDPLSYEILPSTEEETREKENDKALSGNEVITYGTPPNLMDLVDLFGSTGTVQDWSNLMSPTSPTVSELTTPAPSPSPASLAKSAKRRKI